MEEKPNSLSHRDWFVRKLSKSLGISHSVVDVVIRHQFESAVSALQKNKSVEISGFGTFNWSDKASQKRLDDMDAQIRNIRDKIANSDSDVKVQKWNDTIDEMLLKRKILINKINELNTDLRGLEEPSVSRGKVKGTD
jgi:hypothetical protein